MNSVNYTPFESDYYCVMEGWEPKENEDGVIYFSNSHHKLTSWTHPYLEKIFEELSEFNQIRYAAYRTAMKLRYLQLKSGLSWITLRGIKRIMTSTREPGNSYRELNVTHKEAFNIILSILGASDNLCLHRTHHVKAADIIVNLLIELFDTNYEGKFALSSLRISLTALCSAQLSEKYRFFYSEIYNHEEQILQRERLLYLFYDLTQIVEVLKESTAFGTNVSVAVDSCLKYYAAPSDSRSQSEDAFYSWLLLEPQIIVWLPTLHRVAATETTCHNVQCSTCGINPLKGFRYRCLQCFNFDLCQNCFFQGRVSLTHKLKHPLQEYCLPASRKDNTKAVFKILRNKLSRKHRSQSKITYLPLDDDSLTGSVFQWQPRHYQVNPKENFCESTDSGLAYNSENDAQSSVDLSYLPVYTNRVEVEPTRSKSHLEELESNRSSQFVSNTQLSKKDMINQRSQMAKTIEELQQENKYLHERLAMLTKQQTAGVDSDHSLSSHHQSTEAENIQDVTSDDEKTYQVDEVSPIVTSVDIESNERLLTDHEVCKQTYSDEGDSSLSNVMEIVGYYTPVRSSFCENLCQQAVEESLELKIHKEEDGKANGSLKSFIEHTATESLICASEVDKEEKVELDVEVLLTANQEEKDDLTSESTASGGLEYGFSDMSLHSDSLTQKAILKEKEVSVVSEVNNLNKEVLKNTECIVNDTKDSEPKIPLIKNDGTRMKHCNETYGEQLQNDIPGVKMVHKDPSQIEQIPSLSQTNEMNTNEIFFNISDILPEGSTFPVLGDTSNKPSTPGNDQMPERRMTLEPVYMSTPLILGEDSMKPVDKQGKENTAPSGSKETSLQLIASYKCRATPRGVNPKLTVPMRQNKRLLSSHENLSTDYRSGSVDLSHKEIGMTTMFDKVERLGALEATGVGDSLAKGDKEEMEKLMHKLSVPSHSSPEYHQLKHDGNSSSMLNAVLNVGDAMADLVQATAELQQK